MYYVKGVDDIVKHTVARKEDVLFPEQTLIPITNTKSLEFGRLGNRSERFFKYC